METIVDLIIQYAPKFANILGYVYMGLIASRGLLTWVAKLTKTDKDNIFFTKMYAFLDKYGVDFSKFGKK